MTRTFNCYSNHMAKRLQNDIPGWQRKQKTKFQIVKEFFTKVVATRDRHRFDIHGQNRYSKWTTGDVIQFREQQWQTLVAEAELLEYVTGAHAKADQDTIGHFFLKNVEVKEEPVPQMPPGDAS